ncbi:hypothetical protein IID62_08265 [candidate division KSB1 bacterium]|nr:hypothetical protein [candidate division KSB1 bacterium]
MRSTVLKKIAAVVLLLTVAAVVPSAKAQTTIDYEKMDKDLQIMEKVVETIMSDRTIRLHFRSQAPKGVYLDNYGVIFMLPFSGSSNLFYRGEKAETARTSYETLREDLEDFLFSYAGLIKQLRPSDVITLVANMPVSSSNILTFSTSGAGVFEGLIRTRLVGRQSEEQETFEASPFIMTVRKSDVDNAGNLEQFRNSINFSPLLSKDDPYVTPAMDNDIRIMNVIIRAALENKFGRRLSSGSLQGTYLENYGVLFTVKSGIRVYMPGIVPVIADVSDGLAIANREVFDLRLDELERQIIVSQIADIAAVRESDVEKTKRNQEYIKELIEVMAEVIGDYGHTLREVQGDENVTILFSSSSGYWGTSRGPVNLMFNAKYRDILEYSRGSIDLDTFKSRISTRTYE